MPIRTERLDLLPGTRAVLEADLEGRNMLERTPRVEIPESWPPPLYDADAIGWMLERLAADQGSGRGAPATSCIGRRRPLRVALSARAISRARPRPTEAWKSGIPCCPSRLPRSESFTRPGSCSSGLGRSRV